MHLATKYYLRFGGANVAVNLAGGMHGDWVTRVI